MNKGVHIKNAAIVVSLSDGTCRQLCLTKLQEEQLKLFVVKAFHPKGVKVRHPILNLDLAPGADS